MKIEGNFVSLSAKAEKTTLLEAMHLKITLEDFRDTECFRLNRTAFAEL
jgi:hypothetical protein